MGLDGTQPQVCQALLDPHGAKVVKHWKHVELGPNLQSLPYAHLKGSAILAVRLVHGCAQRQETPQMLWIALVHGLDDKASRSHTILIHNFSLERFHDFNGIGSNGQLYGQHALLVRKV